MAKYTLKKKGYKHKYVNRITITFEAILYGATITLTTATLGIVTIHSPNFNNELGKEGKIQVSEIKELSEEEISYFTNKAKNYYSNTNENKVEMLNDSVFIDYEIDNSEPQFDEIEETFEEKTIKKYCAVYQVDYDIVYKKLSDLTDNFTSKEYLNGTIPKITLKDKPVNFTNNETLLLVAVRCCKQTPEALDLSNLATGIKYETEDNLLDQISYYSELFQIDRNLAYAITYSENNFGSDFTDKTNNFSSIKFEGKFAKFDNPTESIIELCTELYKHNRNGLFSIDEIGPIYAPEEDNNENFISNVKANYIKAEEVFRENEVLASNKL